MIIGVVKNHQKASGVKRVGNTRLIWDPTPVREIVFCERENMNPRNPHAIALRKNSMID